MVGRMSRAALLFLSIPVLLSTTAAASQPLQSPESLARRADRVVKARVVGQVQEKDGEAGMRGAFVVSTLQISDTLLGDPVARLEVAQLGGRVGGWESGVVGDARLQRGEEAVFFLRCRDPRQPTRCTLVGRRDGRMPWNPRTGEVELPTGPGVQAAGATRSVTLEQLRARVTAVRQ